MLMQHKNSLAELIGHLCFHKAKHKVEHPTTDGAVVSNSTIISSR